MSLKREAATAAEGDAELSVLQPASVGPLDHE